MQVENAVNSDYVNQQQSLSKTAGCGMTVALLTICKVGDKLRSGFERKFMRLVMRGWDVRDFTVINYKA